MTAPAGYPADGPKILFNGRTLWLPRKFPDFQRPAVRDPAITKGPVYTQVVANPPLNEVDATTVEFPNTSAVWIEGEAAQYFLAAWDSFMDWAGAGKVFSFWRSATDSTAGVSYFQYCVWTLENDGLRITTGNPRYSLNIGFRTEGAARA